MSDRLGSGALAWDIAHLLGGAVLVLSFALLARRRAGVAIDLLAMQAAVVAAAAAWQGYMQDRAELYLAAVIIFGAQAVAVPAGLRRIILRLEGRRDGDAGAGAGLAMAAAAGLVVLSVLAVQPIGVQPANAALTREGLALALSVILLGLLMMVVRCDAAGRAAGFASLANGLILAAIGVAGMPLAAAAVVLVVGLVAAFVSGVSRFGVRPRPDTPHPDAASGEER